MFYKAFLKFDFIHDCASSEHMNLSLLENEIIFGNDLDELGDNITSGPL